MTVSGASSYLAAYGPGYYALIISENDDEAYPIWPHPDTNQIEKDIDRTFKDEAFFKIAEN